MTDLSVFAELVPLDHGLCVLSTLRGDGSVQAWVVNAGVLPHPLTGAQVVGLVAAGGARKLQLLRADPRATIAPGPAGNGQPSREPRRSSVRTIRTRTSTPRPCGSACGTSFAAAGGSHDDWDTLDRVMADDGEQQCS